MEGERWLAGFEWISLKNKRDRWVDRQGKSGWGKWLLLGGVFIIIEGNGAGVGGLRAEAGWREIMIALQVKEVKSFMGKLLGSSCFDSFLLEEATISTYNTFHIDGHMNRDFFSSEEWDDPELRADDFSAWKNVRPLCFDLIKGKKTPSGFKFILHLMPRFIPGILKAGETDITADQVKALVLTCKYDGSGLTLVTGTAFHTFIMDKSVDVLWDRTVRTFLTKKGIGFDEL